MQDTVVWHGFIPEKILHLFEAGHSYGTFNCACLSLDISGFTKMSSALQELGKQGAETISGVLNTCFGVIIKEITTQDGTVCFFAGDAIMAIFMGKNKIRKARIAAQNICSFFASHGEMHTALGTYNIAARLGICEGSVSWNIFGDAHNKACYFGGEAFAKAVEAQQHTKPNSCLISNTGTILLPKVEKRNEFDDIAIETREGEFRTVYSIFCRFGESSCIDIDDETTNCILKLCVEHGAFFNGYDCTDKGKTFLVFFGAPFSVEHIEKHIAAFISEIWNKYKNEISIAVELGNLYTGKIGSSSVSTYTCIGEAINLSAHACLAAEKGQVLFGEAVAAALRGYFLFSEPFTIAIKKATTTVCALIETKHEAAATPSLIGFESELKTIRSCLERLKKTNTGSRLYLWGKAGMGKSALIATLEDACKDAHITYLSISSDNIMQESLLPIRRFFQHYFDCTSYTRFLDSYNKFILTHARKTPATEVFDELQRIAIFLKHIIREKNTTQEPELLEHNDLLLSIQLRLRSFFKNLATLNPLVLVFEDLQWMDKDTKELIELLHKDWSMLPIFLAVTGRPDKQLFSKTRNIHSSEDIMHLSLKPLSKKTTEIMIASLLGGKSGKSITDYIYSKSRGVPFFIEQYTHYLIVHNHLKKDLNQFELKSIPESLPVSVTSVITAIIDTMEPQLKKSVNIASALGNDFYSNIFNSLVSKYEKTSLTDETIKEYKDILMAGEYQRIWKQRTREIYSFLNRLIRDVAYNIQLSGVLVELHIMAAELIEQEAEKNPNFYTEAVYHYEHGKSKADAARCAEKAAAYFADFSLEEAQKYAELYAHNTIEVFGKQSPEAVTAIVFLAGILNQKGNYKKSIQYLHQALSTTKEFKVQDPKEQIKILINLGEAYKGISKYQKAHEALGLAKSFCASQIEIPAAELVKLNEIDFMTYIDEGNLDRCFEILKESEKLVQEPGIDPMSIVTVPYNYGIAYWTCGKYDEALAAFNRSIEMQNEYYEKDLPPIVWTYNNIGAIYNEIQETPKALENLEKAYTIAEKYLGREHPLCATTLSNIAVSYDIMGNYTKALTYGTQALEIRLSIYGETHLDTGTSINNIGFVYMEKEDYSNARKYFDKALRIYLATVGMNSMYSARCHLNLGKVELAANNTNAALQYMYKAKEIFAQLKHEPGLVETEALIEKARLQKR